MVFDNESTRMYIAAIAFRFSYLAEGLNDSFANFEAGRGTKTPLEILRHMTQLINFAHLQFEDFEEPKPKELDWLGEKERFLQKLKDFDQALANGARFSDKLMSAQNLWQGPLADIMTHVGQLAMLRRLAGQPLEKINYWKAPIYDFKK